LQLLSWNCVVESGYIYVGGEVRNVSNASIDDIEDVGAFRTVDHTFVKSHSALSNTSHCYQARPAPFS
jgi:hypothetical protein